MGTVIGLAIGNYSFISEKNTFGDLLLPFSPASLHIEEAQNELGETVIKRYFQLPISKVKEVLDYSGHTLSAAQHDFERAKENKVYIYQRVEEVEKGHRPTADETERFFSFETWCEAVKKYALILSKDTQYFLRFTKSRVVKTWQGRGGSLPRFILKIL